MRVITMFNSKQLENSRFAIEAAKQIIADCDAYGSDAKFATSIYVRQVMKALVKHLETTA